MGGGKEFYELDTWKQAQELKRVVYDIIRRLPHSEKYNIAQQLSRAVCSITANIAEGHGRYSYKENIQFCRIARGSLNETFDFILTVKLLYSNIDIDVLKIEDQVKNVRRLLNGCIRYLQKQVGK